MSSSRLTSETAVLIGLGVVVAVRGGDRWCWLCTRGDCVSKRSRDTGCATLALMVEPKKRKRDIEGFARSFLLNLCESCSIKPDAL